MTSRSKTEDDSKYSARVFNNLRLNQRFNERNRYRYSPYEMQQQQKTPSPSLTGDDAAGGTPLVLLRQEQSLRSNIGGKERNVKICMLSAGLDNVEHLALQRSFSAFTESVSVTIGSRTDEEEWGAPKIRHAFSPVRSSPTWSAHFNHMHLDAVEKRERALAEVDDAVDALEHSTPIPLEDFFLFNTAAAAVAPSPVVETPELTVSTASMAAPPPPPPPEPIAAVDNTMKLKSSYVLLSTSPALSASPPPPAAAAEPPTCLEKRALEFARLVARCSGGDRTLAENLDGLKAFAIAKGTYGSVFSLCIDSQTTAAFKRIKHKHYDSYDECTSEVQSEAQIGAALTRSMLFDARVSCPHFLAHAAYEVTMEPLRFSVDQRFSTAAAASAATTAVPLLSRLHDDDQEVVVEPRVATQIVSEYCEGGTLHQYLSSLVDAGGPGEALKDERLAEEFVGALVAQLLIGVLVAASCQVSHNDLAPGNVFVRFKHTEPDRCLRYEFPRAVSGFGVAAALDVPTGAHVPLLVLGDFGLASVHNWTTDWRVADVFGARCKPKERDRLQRTLPLYYYRGGAHGGGAALPPAPGPNGKEERDIIKFEPLSNLLLTEQGYAWGHYKPLLFAGLDPQLRDSASILSCMHDVGKKGYSEDPERHWCALLLAVTTDALALLNKMRPKNYADMTRFVVTFFGTEPIYARWWKRAPAAAAASRGGATHEPINTCRIPTVLDGARVNANLVRALRKRVQFDVKHVTGDE